MRGAAYHNLDRHPRRGRKPRGAQATRDRCHPQRGSGDGAHAGDTPLALIVTLLALVVLTGAGRPPSTAISTREPIVRTAALEVSDPAPSPPPFPVPTPPVNAHPGAAPAAGSGYPMEAGGETPPGSPVPADAPPSTPAPSASGPPTAPNTPSSMPWPAAPAPAARTPDTPAAPAAAPIPTPTPPPAWPAPRLLKIWLTGYSWQDNTPPGSSTVSHPVLHHQASGTGTYADPITVAVPGKGSGIWNAGARFYLPTVARYVIVEDTGASQPHAGEDGHLDMWIGGQDGTRAATDACMDTITGDDIPALYNPPPDLPVITGPVFTAGTCNVAHRPTPTTADPASRTQS